MSDVTFKQFCERYELDPNSKQALDEWDAYCSNLDMFRQEADEQGVTAKAESVAVQQVLAGDAANDTGWHCVEDEQPEPGALVLCWQENDYGANYVLAWYHGADAMGGHLFYHPGGGDQFVPDVTHWCELPKPPQD